MLIMAVDPGPVESAFVVIETDHFPGTIKAKVKTSNNSFEAFYEEWIGVWDSGKIKAAIEMPACYGMAVGKSVFDTCAQVGRLEAIAESHGVLADRVYRKAPNRDIGIDSVVMALCKNSRAKDSNVRQALIDLYPATGGGKIPQIGTKKEPGPLYGVSKDIWAALAVGITYQMWLKEQ